MDVRLDGRTALITGGSAGLGRAMARRFAASGAAVAIVARRPDVLDAAAAEIAAEAPDATVRAYSCDVSDPAALSATHARIVADLGAVDILVNNAGTSATGAFASITDEAWQADFDLKLFAAIRLSRLVLPAMREQHWGRILNVLNVGAKAPSAGGAPTVVTRAAGLALTKALAGEVAADGVLVNALCTGLLVTEQWERRWERSDKSSSFEEFTARTGRGIPLGRMGEPDEFATLACFLVSDLGSYITGTAINVDGGLCPIT